jgi:hypothetical protein
MHHHAHDGKPRRPYVRTTHNDISCKQASSSQGQDSVSSTLSPLGTYCWDGRSLQGLVDGCCQRIRASVSNDDVVSRCSTYTGDHTPSSAFSGAQLSHPSVFWAQKCSNCFFRRKTCSIILTLSPASPYIAPLCRVRFKKRHCKPLSHKWIIELTSI